MFNPGIFRVSGFWATMWNVVPTTARGRLKIFLQMLLSPTSFCRFLALWSWYLNDVGPATTNGYCRSMMINVNQPRIQEWCKSKMQLKEWYPEPFHPQMHEQTGKGQTSRSSSEVLRGSWFFCWSLSQTRIYIYILYLYTVDVHCLQRERALGCLRIV